MFEFSHAVHAEKFDDARIHGEKSTMKRVDFIIEEAQRILFLEVKDPDVPGAKNPNRLVEELNSGELINDLAGKFRDSLLFASLRRESEKPVQYIVLVCMAALDNALLLNKTDALKSAIPISNKHWNRDAASSCVILNLDSYKKKFGERSVWRASEYE